MISRLELTLDTIDQSIDYNASSLFHGVIMETIDSIYAESLHQSTVHPYSQYVMKISSTRSKWRIQTLNEEAYDYIIKPLIDLNSIFLRKRNQYVKVMESKLIQLSYADLVATHYTTNQANKYVHIKFVTPMSFKIQGGYQIFPDLLPIYRNLMNRFDTFSDHIQLFDHDTLLHLQERTQITDYKLRSTRFYLEKTTIPSIVGDLKVNVNGSLPMQHLVRLLFDYGQYAGIGIKTSLGMGGCEMIR